MRKVVSAAVAATGGWAMALLSVAPAWATLPPTRVTPKGDYFTVELPPGELVHEKVSGTDTTCSAVSRPTLPLGTNRKNQIPTTGNPADGPVVISLSSLHTTHCKNSVPGVLVDVDNLGGWKLVLRHKDNVDTARLVIPEKGSSIFTVIGGAWCFATVAPFGPVTVQGRWTNGNPSNFRLIDALVPADVVGNLPCPQGLVLASISVTFNVVNASHPGTPITVS